MTRRRRRRHRPQSRKSRRVLVAQNASDQENTVT
ncbi:hypothetical protein CTAM01_00293 [Colletotrichum tamarilloi]|uniref:Uncharacterized protein n=1 Tax=Colletotrichum tamarilloi TaxID=1209934 RepID=A0ABQ9RU59_9PEZI|nr:uncharacterized protein CTAM01_00293 [Colletotrichum tamarilloi]KAK1512898.1 hypothetical protein CTAM01_00293 [Colletotrichum tamarilloi]